MGGKRLVERATGIEPVSEAWEASVLPLYEARLRTLVRLKPDATSCFEILLVRIGSRQ